MTEGIISIHITPFFLCGTLLLLLFTLVISVIIPVTSHFENTPSGGDFNKLKLLRLSIKEIRKKKFFSILILLVCVIAMQTVLSAITNATSAAYQQKIFESNIGVDMEQVLHLDYQYTEESPEFANVIRQYLDYIKELPGVQAVGQFDATGMYFSELENMDEYRAINGELLKGQKYENYPGISQLLSIDEECCHLSKAALQNMQLLQAVCFLSM